MEFGFLNEEGHTHGTSPDSKVEDSIWGFLLPTSDSQDTQDESGAQAIPSPHDQQAATSTFIDLPLDIRLQFYAYLISDTTVAYNHPDGFHIDIKSGSRENQRGLADPGYNPWM